MSNKPLLTATQAIVIAAKGSMPANLGAPLGVGAAFVCPYPQCRAYARHLWGAVKVLGVFPDHNGLSSRQYNGDPLTTSKCEACGREVVFVGGALVWPISSEAPPPAADLPAVISAEYAEASAIYNASPRGAAALLRLAIQKLCGELGAPEQDINSAIGGFVAAGRISSAIQKALDAVRVIGNEAVHPGVMDLKDDIATVLSLFGLVNFIVEKMVTEPREIEAIYESLPAGKLAGIAARDKASGALS